MHSQKSKRACRLVFVMFILAAAGCYQSDQMYFPHSRPNVDVVIETPQEDIAASNLAIFNFYHATGIKGLEYYLADYTQGILLDKKLVSEISRLDTHAYSVPEAIERARQEGYDLMLLGYVDHFVDGGLNANSVVSLSIKLIDVRSRRTLWYLRGQIKSQPYAGMDLFLYKMETEKAASPYLLSRKLLEKMLERLYKG